MPSVRAIPDGFHTITSCLTCKNAAKAIDFYKQVFNAQEIMRMDGPGGTIAHAELQIGDSKIMLNDEFPGMTNAPDPNAPAAFSLFTYFENVDSVFDRAVKAGSKIEMPLQDQFWGDRYGTVRDPFGHRWGLAQHIEDVAPDEMERRAKEWQAKMTQSAHKAAGQS
jgi:PhnB protein